MRRTWQINAAAALLVLIAIGRLIPGYSLLSQNYDEPFHIAAGMEWLDKGVYRYEAQHPPLARIADALGPYLAGLRAHSIESGWDEGNAILHSNNAYWRNLTLARLGTWPFVVLGCITILLWARRWFSESVGLLAILLFTSVPPVLAVAGQATTDIACTATLLFALYEFMRWIEQPNLRRSLVFGCALAIGILSKFSIFPFFGACLVSLWLCFPRRPAGAWFQEIKQRSRPLAMGLVLTFVVVWAGYRFSFHSFSAEPGYEKTAERMSKSGAREGKMFAIASRVPVPMPELPHGLYMVARHNHAGHNTFLFGTYRFQGWWYFFPVILGLKTPLGLMMLSISGILLILRKFRDQSWQRRSTALFPLAILSVCMISKLNIGIRHILPIYPFLSLAGAYAIMRSFQSRYRFVLGPIAVALGIWAIADSWMVHPDYMTYFNQLGGSHPEDITVESDMGQDVHRLAIALKELGANRVALKLSTSADLDQEGLPAHSEIPPYTPVEGYVAISDWYREMGYAQNKSYAWLREYSPIRRVGHAIWLYRIPDFVSSDSVSLTGP